jgi:hypothetical protein
VKKCLREDVFVKKKLLSLFRVKGGDLFYWRDVLLVVNAGVCL